MIKWIESSGALPPNPHLVATNKKGKIMKNKKHVITRTNRAECGAVCQNDRLSAGHIWQTRSHVYGEVKCQAEVQSDVVIPNKLGKRICLQTLSGIATLETNIQFEE